MFQILITLLIYMVLVIPIGIYLYHVATKQRTFADPVFDRIDGMIYRICRINREDMHWKTYALNLLMTNAVMILIGYLVLRLQGLLFLNPNGIASMEESLSFNTIISFMTNTNLQHYSGESGLSYLSQTAVIIFMMFTSAATGYAACMAFCRGMAGRPMGNFYEDMVRNTTRILIPLSFIAGMLLIWQGTPQNFHANFTVSTLEGKWQDIAAGPIAALEAIKHVGTNGGGFLGANSSTPLENPTIISNLVELYSMMILPGACVIAFGNMIADKRKKEGKKSLFGRQGRTVFAAMAIIFLIGVTVCFAAESAGNPVLAGIGLNQDMGSYEGKEVRFGIAQSALFTTTTTSFTTGTVNNMHDSLTPLGGLVPLLHMMLNCVFGGKGVGLMNMVMYVILAVFICGLMIGRTPEYLGKKIEGKEMKLVAVCLIIHPLLILGFSALAVSTAGGLAGITNPGFHGLSQVLYEYSSSAANNGSGFEGLADNSVFWNLTTGIAMYFGRFPAIILQLAIAGSIFAKRRVNETVGTLRTDNVVFTLILRSVYKELHADHETGAADNK
ncbi:potassium-transporting ATPase potassium-binding subunit [[Clostridium] symbiosum]|nr:potassium-transporting ATPase potassium-binding subunit [[Clostridium] symbiosum]BDF29339.1 potassium-transporting ATPase potassium-binding subunit [[Clostridium] symbiosum]